MGLKNDGGLKKLGRDGQNNALIFQDIFGLIEESADNTTALD